MAELIPIKASELPLDNSLSAGEVIFAKGDELYRVDLSRILEDNGGGVPSTGKDGVIQGASEHIEDYTFRFIASLYRINGTLYNTVLNSVITFDPSDPVLNRIDLVVIELVDSIPQIKVIKGTPSNPASKPLLTDPDKQIEFTFVTIFAGTSQPTNIENTIVYDENLQEAGGEFDTSITGTGIFLDDTSDPYKGTKAILFENISLDNKVKFTYSSPILTNNSNLLIKLKVLNSASVSGLRIDIGGDSISVTNGNYGFSQYNTSAYQSLIIPLSLFQETSFTEINISSRSAVGRLSTNMLLDDIVIQKGVFAPVIDDVIWSEITGDQSDILLSGFTNDLPSIAGVHSVTSDDVGVDNSDASNPVFQSSLFLKKSLFDANTILTSNADDTPIATTIAESQIIGRLVGGNIKGLTTLEAQTLLGVGVVPKEEAIKGTAKIVLTSTGAQTLNFNTYAHGHFNLTGAGSLTITDPTLAVGETVVRSFKVKNNGFAFTIPTRLTDKMDDDIDVDMENTVTINYVRLDASTLDLTVFIHKI